VDFDDDGRFYAKGHEVRAAHVVMTGGARGIEKSRGFKYDVICPYFLSVRRRRLIYL
jgi:hypothetical protein